MDRRTAATGFSLVEWLVALAVAAILASLGAPALREWATRLRLEAALGPLARGLALARSEAMATGRPVTFLPRELPAGLHWSGIPPSISFGPSGGATPGTLTVCGPVTRGRSLVVSRSGRIRASEASCGFALLEVLVALLLVAGGALVATQSQLLAAGVVGRQLDYRQALDAATAGTESLRAVDGLPSDWSARAAPPWVAAFGVATPSLLLAATPAGTGHGWHVAVQAGTTNLALEPTP